MQFTYQNQKTRDLVTSHGLISGGIVRTQLIDFDVSYRIKDRWTINAGVPLISREWQGGPSHNPLRIVPPQLDSEFVDDGEYHTFFQDLRLGASYAVLSEPIAFEPYLEYGIPASDYPFFAASAVGRHQHSIEVGALLAYRPPFLQWDFSLVVGHTMTDKVLGYETDAMRVTANAVYFWNPRLALNVFVTSKNGKGNTDPPPPTPDFTTEAWYRHDQVTRHNYANVGVGVDWSLSERSVLNFTVLKMAHSEDVFKLRRAMSMSLSRAF
jgi:hypothetical protein